MEIRLFQENGSLSKSSEDLILHFLSLKISKKFVFFLRTSLEYITRYGQGSIFEISFQGSVEIMDPCLYFFEYSPDILKKKTKVLDIFNTNKKCFMKIKIESGPLEIWIRFLEINGSQSLVSLDLFLIGSKTPAK